MRYVVTGSAGFVGSHVCEALLERGHEVDGVDAFTDYYDPSIKRANAARLARTIGSAASSSTSPGPSSTTSSPTPTP